MRWQVGGLFCSTAVSPARAAWRKKKKKPAPLLMCQQYLLFAEGECLYIYRAVIFRVCVLTYIRVLFSWLDKHREMTDLYCRAAVGVWHSKDQFQTVNKAWTRNTSQQNVTRPPSPHLLTLPPSLFSPQLSCGHSTNCSSSLSICRPCYLVPQCAAPRGLWVGRSSGPGQVRREPITFQCGFSALCKEQSVLISVDYRRMLIQCHADRLQRENESITGFHSDSLMSPADN